MTVGEISSLDSHDGYNQTLDREMSINPDPHTRLDVFKSVLNVLTYLYSNLIFYVCVFYFIII